MISEISGKSLTVIKGILGSGLGRSFSLMAPFIVMPFILEKLGADLFGLWMLILSFTAMALFVDFGIGNGLLTKLSYEEGLKNYTSIKSYITSAYSVLILISIVLLLSMFIIMWFLDINFKDEKNAIILVSILTFVLSIPLSVIQKVMYAKQRILEFNLWQIIGSIFSIVFCYSSVQFNCSSEIVILSYSLPPLIVLMVLSLVFFHKNKKISPGLKYFSINKSKDLLKIGSRFLILSILTSIALNVDNLIISHKIGTEMVTEYSVPAKIASLLGLIIGVLFTPLWSANGQAIANKDYDWVLNTSKKMSILGLAIVGIASALIVFFNKQIIHIWMGRDFLNQEYTLFYLCLFSCVMAMASPWYMILNSLSMVKVQIKVWLVYLLISIYFKFLYLNESNIWVLGLISFILYAIIVVPACIYVSYGKIYELKNSNSLNFLKKKN